METDKTIRIVSRGKNGELRTRDYQHEGKVLKMHTQIGIDDCSTDLSLRGMPIFRGLIGPMPEGKEIIRYETPEVFEKSNQAVGNFTQEASYASPVTFVASCQSEPWSPIEILHALVAILPGGRFARGIVLQRNPTDRTCNDYGTMSWAGSKGRRWAVRSEGLGASKALWLV